MTTPKREPFGLFIDVDLPSLPDSYRQYKRLQRDKGSVYVKDERSNVQVWLSGSPSTLRLLADELRTAADETELRMTTQPDKGSE